MKDTLRKDTSRITHSSTSLASDVPGASLNAQPPRLLEAIQTISKHLPKTLIVGGFVRDMLFGISSKDVDLEIYGVTPEKIQEILTELFPEKVIEAGKAFGVLKIPLGEGYDVDVTPPRRESKAGKGHKGFLIESDPNMSLDEAARRRDFTINSMAFDPSTNELLDLYGGQEDLKNKILRVVDPTHFVEDPLRVYRALQFVARFELTVEKKTFDLMKEMVARNELDELSKERVSDEIKKLLLKAEKPSIGFQLAWDLGIIEKYYPELFVLKTTPQEHEWHPEGDVWIHTMMVVDQAAKIVRRDSFSEEEKLQVLVGALCHDLGKPSTTALGEKDGVMRLRSLGHEEAGEEPTRIVLSKWAFGFEIEHAAILSATQHLKPGMFFFARQKKQLNDEQYTNAVRKLLKKIYPLSWKVLLASSEADMRGRAFPDADTKPYEVGELFVKTIQEHKLDEQPTKPLIQGRDLVDRGLKPGPAFGEIIAQIEHARDEGKIKTREEALVLLNEILNRSVRHGRS